MENRGTNPVSPPPPSDAPRTQLLRRLSLKPYGDELLTRGGDFWIFSARLIMFTMALAEAMAWGYMGSLMSRAHPLLTAGIAAGFVFILIWIIDASFMTLDLSRGFYERAFTGKKKRGSLETLKLAGGVAARIGIVTASLVITAPFLAQAIFAEDVREEMGRRNAGVVAAKRQEVEQPFLSRIGELRREQRVLEDQRVQEAAGVGPSGRYGRGPALETIERQLTDKVGEIDAVERSRAAELAQFDRLSRPELEERYAVRLLSSGVQSSGELLQELMNKPQFSTAEISVRAFLAFLFLGLLILKSFQPRSIAVYYNEQLHSIYDEYERGLFDEYLPEAERRNAGGGIDPLRFEQWCITTWAAVRNEDERRREAARETRIHDLLVEQWQRLESTTWAELEPLEQRYEALLFAIDGLEADLHAARTETELGVDELREVELVHESMRKQIEGGGMEGRVFGQAVAAAKDLEERRRALSARVRASENAIERLQKRLVLRRSEAVALREQMTEKQDVLADARKRVAEERLRLSETIAVHGRLWSSQRA